MRLQTGVLLAAVSVCVVCASGCSDSSADKTTTFAVASQSPTLVGYGATPAAWDANHNPESRYTTEGTFEMKIKRPDNTIKYSDFYAPEGHILQYWIAFPKKTSLKAAYRYVMRSEFPADARPGVLHIPTKGYAPATCAGFTVRSKSIRRVLNHGWTVVGVDFSSGGWDHLDTSDVWYAGIHFGAFREC